MRESDALQTAWKSCKLALIRIENARRQQAKAEGWRRSISERLAEIRRQEQERRHWENELEYSTLELLEQLGLIDAEWSTAKVQNKNLLGAVTSLLEQ